MTSTRKEGLEVRYHPDRIELAGDTALIHAEADRILTCFRFSAHPYRIERDGEHMLVLREAD